MMRILKKSKYVINIPIAHLVCQIIIDNNYFYQFLKKEFYSISLSFPVKPNFRLVLQGKDYGPYGLRFTDRKPNKQGIFSYDKDPKHKILVSFFLKAFIEHFTTQYGIFFLHGSAFEKNKKAYVFCGPQGAGKSTIISNVPKKSVLGDDTVILRKINNKFYVYTSPFDNIKFPNLKQQKILLKDIFIIKQANIDSVMDLKSNLCLKHILRNSRVYEYFQERFRKRSFLTTKKGIKYENKHELKIEKLMFEEVNTNLYNLVFDLVTYCKPHCLFFTKNNTFLSKLS